MPAADGRRIGWHTGGGGASAFDVTDPLSPTLLATTNPEGTSKIRLNQTQNYNDFILHNSMRPNADKFVPNDPNPSVTKGNVLVVTEEDYTNDGDELVCSNSGSIETWAVPTLDGTGAGGTALAANAGTGTGTIAPLNKLNLTELGARAFCSAHWFDYHQSGFIAQGFYQGGLNIIDVRDAKKLNVFGFFRIPGATQVWDAYWVPVRDAAGVDTGKKTNIVYTADLIAGLGVYQVNLPGSPAVGPDPVIPEVPVAIVLPLVAAGLLAGSVLLRRRRGAAGSALV